MLILAGSTNRRAREPPTHGTIVCPICGTIFFERDVFKLHVSNCSPNCLMYEINENSQYVFKTLLEKMKFAKSMHRNNNTYMSSEYCFSDDNHKRVKHCYINCKCLSPTAM